MKKRIIVLASGILGGCSVATPSNPPTATLAPLTNNTIASPSPTPFLGETFTGYSASAADNLRVVPNGASVSLVPDDDPYQRTVKLVFDGLPIRGSNGLGMADASDQFHTEGGTWRIRLPITGRGWLGKNTYVFTLKFDHDARYGFEIVSDQGTVLGATDARLDKNPGKGDWLGVGDWSGAGKEHYFLMEVLL